MDDERPPDRTGQTFALDEGESIVVLGEPVYQADHDL